jgi:DNA repair protein RecN (Recombination protein N)
LVASGAEDVPVVLTEISVENVALIEEATLELSPGLNAITGETGAGKTLLATALQLLLGAAPAPRPCAPEPARPPSRAPSSYPERPGPPSCPTRWETSPRRLRTRTGLVLRRTLTEEGRSRCYVGGVSVPVRALASLGERMVSYHSQREQTRLTEPAEQLAILDDFLDQGTARAKGEHGTLWRAVERDRRELQEIRASSEARLREVDFLRFQVSELESAGYDPEEISDLTRERDRLRNVSDLLRAAATATSALSAEDGAGGHRLGGPRFFGAGDGLPP